MMDIPSAAAVVVGTSTGAVKLYSTANFACQAIWIHQGQDAITSFADLGGNCFTAIGGAYGRCEVIQYTPKPPSLLGRPLERKTTPVHATASCAYGEGLLLLGEPGNVVTLWCAEDLAYRETLRASNFQSDCAITCIVPVANRNVFVTGDTGGWLNFFATDSEHMWRLQRVRVPRHALVSTQPGVTCATFFQTAEHLLLAVGDDFGHIAVFDPTPSFGKRNAGQRMIDSDVVPNQAAARQEAQPPVRLSHSEAHPEAVVRVIRFVEGAHLLISGGSDGRVQVSTLAGSHAAYYLLKKVGVDEHNIGVRREHDYNDLPSPYGKGTRENTTVTTDLLSALTIAEDLGGANLTVDVMSIPKPLPAVSISVGRLAYRPFGKAQPTQERPPALVLPGSGEVLYHVPQYIGLEHVEEDRRQTLRCAYQPSLPVLRALYGPTPDFKALNAKMLDLARDRESLTLPHLRRSCHVQQPRATAVELHAHLSATEQPKPAFAERKRQKLVGRARLGPRAQSTEPQPSFFIPAIRPLQGTGVHAKIHATRPHGVQ
jgi:hypothetical protein